MKTFFTKAERQADELIRGFATDETSPFVRDGDRLLLRFDRIEVTQVLGEIRATFFFGDQALCTAADSGDLRSGQTFVLVGIQGQMQVEAGD